MSEEQYSALVNGVPHTLANQMLMQKLASYFEALDDLGVANCETLEKSGEPAVHMTTLMMNGVISHIMNAFIRLDEGNYDQFIEALQDTIKTGPTEALEIKMRVQGQDYGSA